MHLFGGFWMDVTVGFVAGFVLAVVAYVGSHDMKADATSHGCLGNPAYTAQCVGENASRDTEVVTLYFT